jgi:hypothetical protein
VPLAPSAPGACSAPYELLSIYSRFNLVSDPPVRRGVRPSLEGLPYLSIYLFVHLRIHLRASLYRRTYAYGRCSKRMCAVLRSGGFNVCPGRESPLHFAAKFRKHDVVTLLVASGADVTAKANDG